MNKSKTFFSIWALFDYRNQRKIESIKNKVSKIIKGPSFPIHLTISCCFFGKQKEIINQMKLVLDHLSPFYIELDNYDYKRNFFQSFYIKVKRKDELILQKKIIDNVFKLKDSFYLPHVSLFYGNEKKKIKDDIILNLPIFKKIIKINKLCIALNDEKKLKWNIIKTFKIKE